jgi:hypothetical protein
MLGLVVVLTEDNHWDVARTRDVASWRNSVLLGHYFSISHTISPSTAAIRVVMVAA